MGRSRWAFHLRPPRISCRRYIRPPAWSGRTSSDRRCCSLRAPPSRVVGSWPDLRASGREDSCYAVRGMDELELLVAIVVGIFKLIRWILRSIFRAIGGMFGFLKRAQAGETGKP